MKSEMESEGYTLEEYEDEEYTGYKATHTFETFEDLSVDLAGTEAPFSLKKRRRIFRNKIYC